MRVEVVMPQMGESIVEGTVVNWHKKVGDRVKRDEDIFTISTDKVDADIPSPAEGVLDEIKVAVGTTVEVGTVVAYIETDAKEAAKERGRGGDGSERGKGAAPVVSAREEGAAAAAVRRVAEPPDRAPEPGPAAAAAAPVRAAEPAATAVASAAASSAARSGNGAGAETADLDELRRTRSTPLVRKIAREHGIQDLSVVPGTGLSGRVTKRDILSFIARDQDMEEPGAIPAATSEVSGFAEMEEAPRRLPGGGQPIVVEAPPLHLWDDDRVEPMSRMRRSIAEHMVLSRRVSPHVQTVWECDWTRVVKAREALKEDFAARGVKLTYTAFLVRAAVEGLRAHPIVNASVDGDRIVYHNRINVGVAVALPDGLIVPVVKGADELSLLGLARAVNDLSERARAKKLKLDEVEGGTFTITNPGVFGSLFGIPIINQPQVAILGVGAIKRSLVVGDDDSIRIAPLNLFCLSFDHRVVDGAAADLFMQTFVGFLERFEIPRGE